MAVSENPGDPSRTEPPSVVKHGPPPEVEPEEPTVRVYSRTERFVEIPDATPENEQHDKKVRLEKLPDGRIVITPAYSDSTVDPDDLQEALDTLEQMAPSDAVPTEQTEQRVAGL